MFTVYPCNCSFKRAIASIRKFIPFSHAHARETRFPYVASTNLSSRFYPPAHSLVSPQHFRSIPISGYSPFISAVACITSAIATLRFWYNSNAATSSSGNAASLSMFEHAVRRIYHLVSCILCPHGSTSRHGQPTAVAMKNIRMYIVQTTV